jgi:ATP-dependent helicase YprA (DUF1998 family)
MALRMPSYVPEVGMKTQIVRGVTANVTAYDTEIKNFQTQAWRFGRKPQRARDRASLTRSCVGSRIDSKRRDSRSPVR